MRITVVGKDNTTQLQGAITVKAVGAHVTALDNNASFAVDYGSLVQSYDPFIKTINGVGPNSKGEFFIHGSECDSWDYLKDGHGISIVDLCPACRDCELIYRLKQEAIRMKLWLAVLRDVNLYQSPASTQEAQTLWGYRLPDVPSCGKYILGDTFENFAKEEGFKKGLQLIQQYMTTVHMWNYLVNRNNKSDVIQIAPEDTAGFSVQTKRSLTSCNKKQSIRCTIKVIGASALFDDNHVEPLYSLAPSYPVSMFIPRAELTFQPFTKYQTEVGIIPASLDPATGIRSNIDILYAAYPGSDEYVYCRSVDTGVVDAVAAGTYAVNAKFLPFVYSEMVDENGKPISIRGTTATNISGTTTSGGTIEFKFFAEDTPPVPLPNAEHEAIIDEDYLNSKTAPTCSVNFRIIWTIVIKWTVLEEGSQPREEEQTYQYICNGVRRFYSSSVIGGSTINISGGTEQSTDA